MKDWLKFKKIVIFAGIVIIVIMVLNYVLYSGIFTNNEYSNEYNKIFGEFTAKSASELLKDNKENTCYSPISLFSALSLSAELTDDSTRKEILNALGVDNVNELEKTYSQMLEDIELEIEIEEKVETQNPNTPTINEVKKESAKIALCNSLWIDKGCMSNSAQKYIDECKEKLACEIFECKPIEPEKINSWVSEKTDNLIGKIVEEDKEYELVLINTLYYKANWQAKFLKEGDRDFFLLDGECVGTPFIKCEEETMRYKEATNYTAVNVSMQEGDMIFVLPQDNVNLEDLIEEDMLNELLALSTSDNMERGLVTISIPEFECQSDLEEELKDVVKGMGVGKLFADSQWNIIEKGVHQKVDIAQKTNIKVDENGVEAVAVTAIKATYTAAKDEKQLELDITFNRPFLYILMKDEVPLFIGTVYNPAE